MTRTCLSRWRADATPHRRYRPGPATAMYGELPSSADERLVTLCSVLQASITSTSTLTLDPGISARWVVWDIAAETVALSTDCRSRLKSSHVNATNTPTRTTSNPETITTHAQSSKNSTVLRMLEERFRSVNPADLLCSRFGLWNMENQRASQSRLSYVASFQLVRMW